MNLDETNAVQALSFRLTEWGVEGAPDKAVAFISALVSRGWVMDPKSKPTPRNPPPAEECRIHPGEWRINCRCCQADRKAQQDADDTTRAEAARLTREQAIAAARAGIRRTVPTEETQP